MMQVLPPDVRTPLCGRKQNPQVDGLVFKAETMVNHGLFAVTPTYTISDIG